MKGKSQKLIVFHNGSQSNEILASLGVSAMLSDLGSPRLSLCPSLMAAEYSSAPYMMPDAMVSVRRGLFRQMLYQLNRENEGSHGTMITRTNTVSSDFCWINIWAAAVAHSYSVRRIHMPKGHCRAPTCLEGITNRRIKHHIASHKTQIRLGAMPSRCAIEQHSSLIQYSPRSELGCGARSFPLSCMQHLMWLVCLCYWLPSWDYTTISWTTPEWPNFGS